MESRIFGVPVIIWFFLVGLGLIIGLPMVVLHNNEMRVLTTIAREVAPTPTSVLLPTVTASPSATPTVLPTVRTYTPVYKVAPTTTR